MFFFIRCGNVSWLFGMTIISTPRWSFNTIHSWNFSWFVRRDSTSNSTIVADATPKVVGAEVGSCVGFAGCDFIRREDGYCVGFIVGTLLGFLVRVSFWHRLGAAI